ncbi:MAG: hypothetical protein ACI9NC_005237 [Verrucomicrobiales bacterium]
MAAIIVGVILIIFVALAVWAYFAVKDKINFSTEPAKVTLMADQIAEIDLGEKWEPQFSMNIMIIRMTMFISDDQKGVAFLMDGDSKMGSGDQFEAEMRAEMEKSAQRSGGSSEGTTQVSSDRQDFMVRGEATSFLVVNSEGTDSKTKFLEVSGTFPSAEAGRTAFLMIKAPEATYSMDEIKAAIESIK